MASEPTFTEGQEQDKRGDLYYDEDTMKKVREAIMRTGVQQPTVEWIILEMQNVGILFRERGKF